MTNHFPEDLFSYYKSKPDMFAFCINRRMHIICYAIAAVAMLLMLFPGLVPLKGIVVRLIAFAGLLYAGLTISLGGREWRSIASGGRITAIAVKHFARPMNHAVPGGSEDRRILSMFAGRNWAALASEPSERGNPLHLHVHEDVVGRTFYLQLCRRMEAGLLPTGVSEVASISAQEYTLHYDDIKAIK
ncbi:MAG: hypothetical protein LBD21_01310 [Tannerellaceae bacterium]|jgi:hypothetical protein|nr:hypothetical protein [Tannerellaceae bacterium]